MNIKVRVLDYEQHGTEGIGIFRENLTFQGETIWAEASNRRVKKFPETTYTVSKEYVEKLCKIKKNKWKKGTEKLFPEKEKSPQKQHQADYSRNLIYKEHICLDQKRIGSLMPVFVEYQIFNWMAILVKIRASEIHRRVPLNTRKWCYTRIFTVICIMQHMNAKKIRVSTAWSTIGTFIYTVCSRYSYPHCLKSVQVSTLSTVDTAFYIVFNRYNYPHCLQWIQLSTLSTEGTAIYTVYNR